MRNKFGAVKTEVDGIIFHSKREARRYRDLNLLDRAGEIRNIELQPEYAIEINGKHICKVILDFRYEKIIKPASWVGGSRNYIVIEDVKGKDTPMSKLKRKLVEAAYGIEVVLV